MKYKSTKVIPKRTSFQYVQATFAFMKDRQLQDLVISSNRDSENVWADLCRFVFKEYSPSKAQFFMNRWTRNTFKYRTLVQDLLKNENQTTASQSDRSNI